MAYWKHAENESGDDSVATRSTRATDDLLSDGLMRALLSTRCYRPPGLNQLFIEVTYMYFFVIVSKYTCGCARSGSRDGSVITE